MQILETLAHEKVHTDCETLDMPTHNKRFSLDERIILLRAMRSGPVDFLALVGGAVQGLSRPARETSAESLLLEEVRRGKQPV